MSRYGDLIQSGLTPHEALAIIYNESMARKQDFIKQQGKKT